MDNQIIELGDETTYKDLREEIKREVLSEIEADKEVLVDVAEYWDTHRSGRHSFIIPSSEDKFIEYCNEKKLNPLEVFECEFLEEAKQLSDSHKRNGKVKTEIIIL